MATSWQSQQGGGKYSLQFETDDKKLYQLVEKAAQKAVDLANKKQQKQKQHN